MKTKMKTYEVQVINPMTSSVKKVLKARNRIDAKAKAAKIFKFKGNWKFIIVNEI